MPYQPSDRYVVCYTLLYTFPPTPSGCRSVSLWHWPGLPREKPGERTDLKAKVEEIPEEQRITRAWRANDKSPMPPTRQERDDYIVRLYQMGWKQEEIAKEVGLSKSQISRIVGSCIIQPPDTRRLKPSDRIEALRHHLLGRTLAVYQTVASRYELLTRVKTLSLL